MRNLLKTLKIWTRQIHTSRMACSKYEYVKSYELDDKIMPNVWIVVRIDGKGFTKFTTKHKFEKPNDIKGIYILETKIYINNIIFL